MYRKALYFALAFLPSLSYAAGTSTAAGDSSGTLVTIANAFTSAIVNSLSTLAIAIAMATFFYGGFRYIVGIRNGEEKALHEGNKFLVWGGVTLFVMVSMWGIISMLQGTFGLSSATIKIPNASLNFIGSGGAGGANSGSGGGGTSGNGSQGGTGSQSGNGSGAQKAKDSGGVCEPDADGTTYHEDPDDHSQCIEDDDNQCDENDDNCDDCEEGDDSCDETVTEEHDDAPDDGDNSDDGDSSDVGGLPIDDDGTDN
jgi:hypothetical protein